MNPALSNFKLGRCCPVVAAFLIDVRDLLHDVEQQPLGRYTALQNYQCLDRQGLINKIGTVFLSLGSGNADRKTLEQGDQSLRVGINSIKRRVEEKAICLGNKFGGSFHQDRCWIVQRVLSTHNPRRHHRQRKQNSLHNNPFRFNAPSLAVFAPDVQAGAAQ